MENPFLQMRKFNLRLKILVVLLTLGIILTYCVTLDYVEQKYMEYIQVNKELTEEQKLHNLELQKMKHKLEIKEAELKKYTLTKLIISDFIRKENSSLSSNQANAYAMKIMSESHKQGFSPYVQTAVLASESSFRSNPKHAISTVYGMGGIYAKVWAPSLKAEGIISSNGDLLNPYKNIEASAYVIAYYNNKSPNIRTALAKYKGYCALGRSQGNTVMTIAIKLKQKEKEMNA